MLSIAHSDVKSARWRENIYEDISTETIVFSSMSDFLSKSNIISRKTLLKLQHEIK